MAEKYELKNNNKSVGIVKAYVNNFKKFMLMSTIGFTVLTATGCGQKEPERVEVTQTTDYTYSYEPTYKVQYKVEAGDTLTGIIYSYESDANKVYRYIDQVVDINDLPSASQLRQGEVITLVGVPESKLENFGYSSDYTLFPASYEIEDRVKYINHYNSYIYEAEDNETEVAIFRSKVADLEKRYADWQNEKDPETKTYLEDLLLEEYRDLCEELRSLVGVSFDEHHSAYPLSDSLNKEDVPGLG